MIEALIAVLVLSVGILGLGTLQARLWAVSAQLYATTEATLLTASDLERSLGAGIPGSVQDQHGSIASPSGYAAFEETVRQGRIGRLQEVWVRLRWQDSEGKQNITLQSAAYTPEPAESRWLLDGGEE